MNQTLEKFLHVKPAVVGTITTEQGMQSCLQTQPKVDILECRLDHVQKEIDARFEQCRTLVNKNCQLIITLRHEEEGGYWNGDEKIRLRWLRSALEMGAAVDIEINSKIAPEISQIAAELKQTVIFSYHNFERTPSLGELTKIISMARTYRESILKIATHIKETRDLVMLAQLLEEHTDSPLCLLGMGPLGKISRVLFPFLGSCLTYGYLDKPAAPGQLEGEELVKMLRILKK